MVGIIEPIEETEDKKKIRELTQEKEWILSNIPSLAQYISLFPHNVILGKFDTFGTIFKEGSVNFGWSFRSTSHLDDNAYAETIEAAAISLAPGGVFLDDGKRESWTRFERISPLKTLQTKLGREYKIKVICTSQKANAVLIERGIVRDDGILVFFSDQYGNEILSEGANLINPGWLELEMPILSTRNRIISKIRDIIVPKSPNGLKSRMDFKDVHPVIENEISMAFNGVDFIDTDLISISDKIAEEVIEVLCNDSEITIKEKLKARAVPVGGDEAAIQTFPLNVAYGRTSYPVINDQRNIPVSLLPRNFEAPTLENLSHKVGDLFNSLNKLRKWIGTQPIEIVEFDDCFTNSLLEKTLHQILFENCFIHKVDFEELVKVRNISLYDRNFPDLCESNSPLLILGGSEANASEEAGECFSDNVCNPLLRHIQEGVLKRILAICFGSQAMLQAYGKIKEIPIITVPGALQFGAFPAVFSGTQTNILQELSDGIYSVGMTRGWYSDTLGKRPSDLIPIAYEADVQNGRLMPALNLPPLGFSIFNGEIIAIQFHPELPLSGEDAIDKPVEWMYRNERLLKRKYDLPLTENGRIDFESYFKPLGREKKGIAPWIKRDIGPVFLLNTLLKHAKECLKYSPT